jgi:hypothetical protein
MEAEGHARRVKGNLCGYTCSNKEACITERGGARGRDGAGAQSKDILSAQCKGPGV